MTLTPRPVTSTAVIATGEDSAPAGTVSVCGPTRIVPPLDPMVRVAVAYERLEHCSSPVPPRRSLMIDAWGAVGGPDSGELIRARSVHPATASAITSQ